MVDWEKREAELHRHYRCIAFLEEWRLEFLPIYNYHEEKFKSVRRSLYKHRYSIRCPERVAAERVVREALQQGALTRPDMCEKCGKEGKVLAHHKSYDAGSWREVVWLCASCHRRIHGGSLKLGSDCDRCGRKLGTMMVKRCNGKYNGFSQLCAYCRNDRRYKAVREIRKEHDE